MYKYEVCEGHACDDEGEDGGSEGVLLSSDLCFHFLAAAKIFVLKLIAFYILTKDDGDICKTNLSDFSQD